MNNTKCPPREAEEVTTTRIRHRWSFTQLPVTRSGFLWQQRQKDAKQKSEVKREIKGITRI